jgi:hypothetical protein
MVLLIGQPRISTLRLSRSDFRFIDHHSELNDQVLLLPTSTTTASIRARADI